MAEGKKQGGISRGDPVAAALFWLGRRADAQKQFALAGTLDLTQAERAQLEHMEALHD